MLPKLIHQSFPSNRRIRVTFVDPAQHDIYLADFDGLWLDTELLPQASMLRYEISDTHFTMLSDAISALPFSLEDAYNFSPTIRSLAFTLYATWTPETTGGPGITVCFGNKWHNPTHHQITLPQVAATAPTTLMAAELEMEVWSIQNATTKW